MNNHFFISEKQYFTPVKIMMNVLFFLMCIFFYRVGLRVIFEHVCFKWLVINHIKIIYTY